MTRKRLPMEALVDLRRRLNTFPPHSAERRRVIQETAPLYGVSEATLYRLVRESAYPKALRRADCGIPRVMPKAKMVWYCEVIAALQVRTTNKKGRSLSTVQAIRLLEEYGIETPQGLVKAPKGLLKLSTLNRYLKHWGYDRHTLCRPPPAVRFQARFSNECWHVDLSPSDLKYVKAPAWLDPERGHPQLMLYSAVDDRSGAAYQEYHGVYGEDVEAALRFLFNAMAPKANEAFVFQGIPAMLYMDSGPIARSLVFQKVMGYLGVEVRTHLPQGKDGRRVTARSKGKVERPFRSVKEMHETLYHLHEPDTEAEANAWLMQFLLHYNHMAHRLEPHSRLDDWLQNLPPAGFRAMCSWERFCTFAREPERRTVGVDARVSVAGTAYQVDPELAGETVVLWWGLFDNELYVEHEERRYGPFAPVAGPIPLHRYRGFKKTRTQARADRIEVLAEQLSLPRAALDFAAHLTDQSALAEPVSESFTDPDPFQELAFPSPIAAKRAIADYLGMPLAKLAAEQLAELNQLLTTTLRKEEVLEYARTQLKPARPR